MSDLTGILTSLSSTVFRQCAGNNLRALSILCLFVFLAGCQTKGDEKENSETPVIVDAPGAADDSVKHETSDVTLARLWSATEVAMQNDQLEQADILISEALDVAPNDSVVLSRAAELKLALNDPVLAETLASRSLSLNNTNRNLAYRNWLIIEHAREMRGDLLGKRDAHKMAMKLQPAYRSQSIQPDFQ